MTLFEIWSSDLFDRESSESLEGDYPRLDDALTALWQLVLTEVVEDDGRPTFTDFQLRSEGRRTIRVPRDPSQNPELALLRSQRHRPGFYVALARVHGGRLDQPFDFEPFLELGPEMPPPRGEGGRGAGCRAVDR